MFCYIKCVYLSMIDLDLDLDKDLDKNGLKMLLM